MRYIVDPTPQGDWTHKQVGKAPPHHFLCVTTVQEAVDLAEDSDKIIIGPMTSDESIDLRPLIGKRVEIRGEP